MMTEVRDALDLFEAHRRLDDLESFTDVVRELLDYLETSR